MKKQENGMTRRDFITRALGLILAGPAALDVFAKNTLTTDTETSSPPSTKKATVVLIRDADVLDANGNVHAEILAKMLDDAVTELLGIGEPVKAWKHLIKAKDTVGIKSNAWRFLPTPRELEQAIKQRVMDCGVPAERIAIDDRGVLRNSVFQNSTALINTSPLKTHYWAGVGGLIKNHIMFSPSPSSWHRDSCADLAKIWHLPIVKDKTRLNVLVMLTPLFYGKGPHHFQKEYTWRYNGLIVGTDPVACDATGVRILEAKRREHFGSDRPFEVSPKHIRIAEEKHHLGIADANLIEVKKMGWQDNILI